MDFEVERYDCVTESSTTARGECSSDWLVFRFLCCGDDCDWAGPSPMTSCEKHGRHGVVSTQLHDGAIFDTSILRTRCEVCHTQMRTRCGRG